MSVVISHSKAVLATVFTVVAILALFPGKHVRAAEGTQATVRDVMAKPHPRLLLSDERLREIQKTATDDPVMAKLLQVIRNRAESYLDAPPAQFTTNDQKLLKEARMVLSRVLALCFEYRLSGDERFAEAAKRELLNVSAFPRWFNKHFLRAGEMSTAVSIGYDWLYHVLSPEERDAIRDGLVRNGLSYAPDAYDPSGKGKRHSGWNAFGEKALAYTNHNPVNNGGFLAAALALCEEEPDLAQTVFDGVRASLPKAMQYYAPDGAWPEGPVYWSYGLTYTALVLDLLEKSFGTDFGLGETPGFDRTIDFGLYIFGATGVAFNFGDSGPGKDYTLGGGAEMTWVARRHEDSQGAMGILRDRLERSLANPSEDRFLVLHAIWFPTKAKKEPTPLHLDIQFEGVAELALFRSSWGDVNALWLGLKAGENGFPHGHLDLGSFVLEADGIRWSTDLGSDNYSLERYFDSAKGGRRWTYFRCNNFGHSTLTLDMTLQDVTATAPIKEFSSRPDFAFAIVDLTAAYPGKAKNIQRGAAMLDRSRILIQDEVSGAKPGTMIDWRMVTDADVIISEDGRTATLKQDGKEMTALILIPPSDQVRFEVESVPPAQSGERPRGSAKLLKISYAAAGTSERLAVFFTPVGESWPSLPLPEAGAIRPLKDWK